MFYVMMLPFFHWVKNDSCSLLFIYVLIGWASKNLTPLMWNRWKGISRLWETNDSVLYMLFTFIYDTSYQKDKDCRLMRDESTHGFFLSLSGGMTKDLKFEICHTWGFSIMRIESKKKKSSHVHFTIKRYIL